MTADPIPTHDQWDTPRAQALRAAREEHGVDSPEARAAFEARIAEMTATEAAGRTGRTADPMPWGDLPLPPELAEPEPGDDVMLEQVVASAVDLADTDALPVAKAAAQMAESPGRWHITDDGQAEWAMRHVVKATEELAQLQAQGFKWQARIQAWFDHRARPLQATVAFMTAHLERYAVEVREADPKRKTLVLPSGAVSTTGHSPKVDITNEPRAVVWARQHAQDALQPQPPKLLVSLLRRYVKPVQLLTEAELTFSCGHVMRRGDPDGLKLPDVGTEMECSDHGPVLLGRVDPLATRWVAMCTTEGTLAEGVEVDPGGVTAKVVPAP